MPSDTAVVPSERYCLFVADHILKEPHSSGAGS